LFKDLKNFSPEEKKRVFLYSFGCIRKWEKEEDEGHLAKEFKPAPEPEEAKYLTPPDHNTFLTDRKWGVSYATLREAYDGILPRPPVKKHRHPTACFTSAITSPAE
jgi:hypothetical protein